MGDNICKQWINSQNIQTAYIAQYQKKQTRDFPGGAVIKNPPANAGDTGSIPGAGRSHMLQSN